MTFFASFLLIRFPLQFRTNPARLAQFFVAFPFGAFILTEKVPLVESVNTYKMKQIQDYKIEPELGINLILPEPFLFCNPACVS